MCVKIHLRLKKLFQYKIKAQARGPIAYGFPFD